MKKREGFLSFLYEKYREDIFIKVDSLLYTFKNFVRIVVFIAGLFHIDPYLSNTAIVFDRLNFVVLIVFLVSLLLVQSNEVFLLRFVSILGLTLGYNTYEFELTSFYVPVINFTAFDNLDFDVINISDSNFEEKVDDLATFIGEYFDLSRELVFYLSLAVYLSSYLRNTILRKTTTAIRFSFMNLYFLAIALCSLVFLITNHTDLSSKIIISHVLLFFVFFIGIFRDNDVMLNSTPKVFDYLSEIFLSTHLFFFFVDLNPYWVFIPFTHVFVVLYFYVNYTVNTATDGGISNQLVFLYDLFREKHILLLQQTAVLLAFVALFYFYLSFNANSYYADFSSGSIVTGFDALLDRIEDRFDATIVEMNKFVRSIAVCSTTQSEFYTENRPPDLDALRTELSSIDYFRECFNTGTNVFKTSLNSKCRDMKLQFDEAVRNASDYNSVARPLDGVIIDKDFRDDFDREVNFEVITFDQNCLAISCNVFTVVSFTFFALTLIPFLNVFAATALKVAQVAFRVMRLGIRIVKKARKIYKKRRKLSRFIVLIKKLNVFGKTVLKYQSYLFIILLPVIVLAIIALLIGFFPRNWTEQSIKSKVIFNIVLVYIMAFSIVSYLISDYILSILENVFESFPKALLTIRFEVGTGHYFSQAAMVFTFLSSFLMLVIQVYDFLRRKAYTALIGDRIQIKTNRKKKLVSYLTALCFSLPILYFLYDIIVLTPYGTYHLSKIEAVQDGKLAEILESIEASDFIKSGQEDNSEDLDNINSACGFISILVEEAYAQLINPYRNIVNPLIEDLDELREKSLELVTTVQNRIKDTTIESINLTFSLDSSATEVWFVAIVPLLFLISILILNVNELTIRNENVEVVALNALMFLLFFGVNLLGVVMVIFQILGPIPLFEIRVSVGQLIYKMSYMYVFMGLTVISLQFDLNILAHNI